MKGSFDDAWMLVTSSVENVVTWEAGFCSSDSKHNLLNTESLPEVYLPNWFIPVL